MAKRTASELKLDIQSDTKKRKLSIEQNNTQTIHGPLSTKEDPNHNHNNSNNKTLNRLCNINTRESFLRNKRRWIQYNKHLNHQKEWNNYSESMENIYNGTFPDLHEFKIGNLITFRKNAQFEFMTGIILRAANTNTLNIYSESSTHICIKLLPDSLTTQTINEEICNLNKTNTNTLINKEKDIYSFIPKQTFQFEYSDQKFEANHNIFTQKEPHSKEKSHKKARKIHKKEMKFDSDIIHININDYGEIIEHREVVWSQIEGFEWHPSQILFKWKHGVKVSPSLAKQQFGLLYVLVAYFEVHQTAQIRLSQRYLIPLHSEPNLDILSRTRRDYKKFNLLTNTIHNACILAVAQLAINNKLHNEYHHHIHVKNAFKLKLCKNIPNEHWLYQKVYILNKEKNAWHSGRIMYYWHKLQQHFIVYDDNASERVEWIKIESDNILLDWCDDGGCDNNNESIHSIKEINGYGVDECTTNVVSISTRLIAELHKNCNKCWFCNELVAIVMDPDVNNIECIHCICCRRRAHLKCLGKCGITNEILRNNLLCIHCDECRNCVLCKKQLSAMNIIEWTLKIFNINQFMNDYFVKLEDGLYEKSMIECNLCRRRFHKKCLPNKYNENGNNKLWLCFDCRICRCCNSKMSLNNEWFDGYTLCCDCYENEKKICKICFKSNSNNIKHEPFLIECHECNALIHLSCSPYKLDEILIANFKNMQSYFICCYCLTKIMQKLQLNVIEILIKNDKSGIVIRNINSILILRSYLLSKRISLMEFINIFMNIIFKGNNRNILHKMMDYLCQVIAKLFNHFCLPYLIVPMQKMKCIKMIKINESNDALMHKCEYFSSNESLLLRDKCYCCGSTEDINKLIICARCGITIHSFCMRSNIDFAKTDNIGYCYHCLWFYHKNNKLNKINKSIILKQTQSVNNNNNNTWILTAMHLKELYELLQTNNNNNNYDDFIINNNIPSWIKPLLYDIINGKNMNIDIKQRRTTKANTKTILKPLKINTENEYKSSLYLSLNNVDNKNILNEDSKCEICHYYLNKSCGRLLPIKGGCKWMHTKCVLSSTDGINVNYNHKYGTNIIEIDVTKLLSLCPKHKCHICNKFGAAIHCSISDCAFSYHYPCIVDTQMYDDWQYNLRPFFCNMHKIHYNNHKNILHSIVNQQNLFDECCIILYNTNNSNNNIDNNVFKVKGNIIIKQLKDSNNNIILYQTYDIFWSYCNCGKRTQFIYESYGNNNNKYKYKLIVADDPLSYNIFSANDSSQIFQTLIQKYPNGFDKSLFDNKYSFFL